MENPARLELEEKDFLACCGSTNFAKEMAALSPFPNLDKAIEVARDIWFNKVGVLGWLEAFSAHPQIGQTRAAKHSSETSAQWSKGEQSTAMATATSATLQELTEWNALYKEKFGFIFLICASGRSTAEVLAELKTRYSNRPIVEFEIAAQEQMKITELRLVKLVSERSSAAAATQHQPATAMSKAEEDRLSMIGAHLTSASEAYQVKISQAPKRSKPPITTHVLDVAQGHPGRGVELLLEMWTGPQPLSFPGSDPSCWSTLGSGVTDEDGRGTPLMSIVDAVKPGIYRISFNSGKYYPNGFYPFVSVVFRITESQKFEHFHVPLLMAPFGFSTYRGS